MNKKGERKRNVRPKNDLPVRTISEPYDFRHDLHIGQDEYHEKPIDTDDRPVSPPTPCHSSSNSSGDIPLSGIGISQIIKEEIIPVLRHEIGSIVVDNVRKMLHEQSELPNTRHCMTCSCVEKQNEGSFYQTVHHEKAHTSVTQKHHGSKLEKYGSDLQLALTERSTNRNSAVFSRSKTLPASANRINSFKPNEMHKINGRPLSKSDERVCLANALQWHIEEIVEGIVFRDSEMPDDLLADSCLTEDECAGLRKTPDRKDQVRVLLSIIKGRDFDVLKRFLKHLKSQNESVGRSIEEKFEQNKQDGMRCSKCALCNLSSNVNLKYVADHLWKHDLIDMGLYNWIIQTDRPAGVQVDLWHEVIFSLNKHCVQSPSNVRRIIGNALKKNNHYHHLAQGVEWMIYKNGELLCRCDLQHNMIPAGSFLSLQSSRSPQSSVSEFVTDSQSDVSRATNATTNNFIIKEGERQINSQNVIQSWEHKVSGKVQGQNDRIKPKAMTTVNSIQESTKLPDDILLKESHSSLTTSNYGLERNRRWDEISSDKGYSIVTNSELERQSLPKNNLSDGRKSPMTPTPFPKSLLQDENTPEEEMNSLTTPTSELKETKQENTASYKHPTMHKRPIVLLLMDKCDASAV